MAEAMEPATDDIEVAHREVSGVEGVPDYLVDELRDKGHGACVLVPVINEGERIASELRRMSDAGIPDAVDIVICDGGSTDGSLGLGFLAEMGVRALLTKTGAGKQGAQLRNGIHYALGEGYDKVLMVDGNDKDSVESIPLFLDKLDEGYGYVQGSRFVKGGHAVNTPVSRLLAARLIHAPMSSLASRTWLTDTTNAFRGYSAEYLSDPRVQPLRDLFVGYELLAYLCVRAGQLGYPVCEVPVDRAYPAEGKTPTKIGGLRGNMDLMRCLTQACLGKYAPTPGEVRAGIARIKEGD